MVQLELGKNLLKYINTYDIDSSEYVIAKKALTLSKDLEKLSINDFTDLCFVSPPTISRFCKKEGCNNFIEFKTKLLEIKNVQPLSLYHIAKSSYQAVFDKPKEYLIQYATDIGQNLINCANCLDIEQIDNFIDLLNDTENIYFFACSTSLMMLETIQTNLLYSEKLVSYGDSCTSQLKIVQNLRKNDLVVIVSCFGNYLHRYPDIVDYITQSKTKSIIITQNPSLTELDFFDEAILFAQENTKECGIYPMLFGIEYLVRRYSSIYHI